MATLYEVLANSQSFFWKFGAAEETSFNSITAGTTLTLDDPRITLVDPTAGALTIYLPASPYVGYSQDIRNVTALTTPITINGNGNLIDGNATTIIGAPYGRCKVQYLPASGGADAQYVVTESLGTTYTGPIRATSITASGSIGFVGTSGTTVNIDYPGAITVDSGAELNLVGAGQSNLVTSSNSMRVDAATTVNIGTTLASAVQLGRSGQSLGHYGATPVAQPSSTGQTTGFTAGAGTTAKDDSTYTGGSGTKAYTVGDIVKHLKALGLLATS